MTPKYRAGSPPRKYCGKCEVGWIRVPDLKAYEMYRDKNATLLVRCPCRQGAHFREYERQLAPWRPPV